MLNLTHAVIQLACASASAGGGAGTFYTIEADLLARVDPCTRHVVKFDNLPHDTQLFAQYADVSFAGTGRTWNAILFGGGGTAQSPPNVLFNYGVTPITLTFNPPIHAFGWYNPSLSDVIKVDFRDADGALVASGQMPSFGSGVTYLGYVFDVPIATVTASGVAGQSNFTIFLDTMTFGGATSCPADLNEDGAVDGADLGLLLAGWGTAVACLDLNGDGVVNGADLGLLLSGWGGCPRL